MSASSSRLPVAIIGAGDATPGSEAYRAAYEVAHGLARRGLVILCGGRSGVMEAACRGAAEAGGISIGILPHLDLAEANPFASILLPTDLGSERDPICGDPNVSRNRVIAAAARCLVAVGGSIGTANEIRHALTFNKTVFGISGSPEPEAATPAAPGAGGSYVRLDSPAAAIEHVLEQVGSQNSASTA
jgi:uncharacterized protein (TIGR00725 family)